MQFINDKLKKRMEFIKEYIRYMNLLNIKVIKRACIKLSHLKNIKYIASLNEDEMLRFLYVFAYGRIVGIQEERSRRQGKDYEVPTLVDDTSM